MVEKASLFLNIYKQQQKMKEKGYEWNKDKKKLIKL